MRLRDIGEDGFIEILSCRFPQIGDDCSLLPDGRVITTDMFLLGTHFVIPPFTWRQVGTKCVCAAISDVIAMGARPEGVLISLGVPPDEELEHLEEFYRGVEDVAERYGFKVAGGDTCKFEAFVVNITAWGLPAERPILRSTAKPGDTLFVTGTPGASAVGLEAILKGLSLDDFIKKHVFPDLRLKFSLALAKEKLASSMMDISDGLIIDASRLARLSGVALEIDRAKLPSLNISTEDKRLLQHKGEFYILHGGEDFELLFTSPFPSKVMEVAEVTDTPVTAIGRVVEGEGVYIVEGKKKVKATHKGYSHF